MSGRFQTLSNCMCGGRQVSHVLQVVWKPSTLVFVSSLGEALFGLILCHMSKRIEMVQQVQGQFWNMNMMKLVVKPMA